MILPRQIKKIEVQVAALFPGVTDNSIYLSARAVVKPIKVISDCSISVMFLKSVSGKCSKPGAPLSLRGARKWPCA